MCLEKHKPFLLWYAPFLPHTPHNPPQRLLKKYAKDGRALDVAKYYAMVEWLDETCGELMNKLNEKGLRENTVVIYICDNGWGAASTTLDWPREQAFGEYAMRSKASPYENGTRTPILVSWPGTIQPKTMDGFAHSIDIFPTIAAAAGLETPDGLPGINLLDEKAVNGRDTIFGSMNASHNINIWRSRFDVAISLVHRGRLETAVALPRRRSYALQKAARMGHRSIPSLQPDGRSRRKE